MGVRRYLAILGPVMLMLACQQVTAPPSAKQPQGAGDSALQSEGEKRNRLLAVEQIPDPTPWVVGQPRGKVDSKQIHATIKREERIPPRRDPAKRSLLSGTDYVKWGNWIEDWPDTSSSYPASGAYARHRINNGLVNTTDGDMYAPTMLPPKGAGLETMTVYQKNGGPNVSFYNWSSQTAYRGDNGGSIPSHGWCQFTYDSTFQSNYTWVDTSTGYRYYWVEIYRTGGSQYWDMLLWNTQYGRWDLAAYVTGNASGLSGTSGWNMFENNNESYCMTLGATNKLTADTVQVYGRNPNTGVTAWVNVTQTYNSSSPVPGMGTNLNQISAGGCTSYTKTVGNYNSWAVY